MQIFIFVYKLYLFGICKQHHIEYADSYFAASKRETTKNTSKIYHTQHFLKIIHIVSEIKDAALMDRLIVSDFGACLRSSINIFRALVAKWVLLI